MKKIGTILVLAIFLVSFVSIHPLDRNLGQTKSELQENSDLKVKKKRNSTKKELKDPISEKQLKDQKKREIEVKEHSIDKNKKVKRVSSDENLPETVKKRNIP